MGNSPCLEGNEKQISKITLLSNKCYDTNKHRPFGEALWTKGVQPGSGMERGSKGSWGKVNFSPMVPAGFSVSSLMPGTCVESMNKWTTWLLDLILKDCWICPSECIQMIIADEERAWGMVRPWASEAKVWEQVWGCSTGQGPDPTQPRLWLSMWPGRMIVLSYSRPSEGWS